MNWMMSNPVAILEILLLSSLTGTVVLAVWYLASCFFCTKGYFHFFYQLLCLMPICFLFPFSILVLQLPYFESRFVYSYLFWPAPSVYYAAGNLLAVWGIGAACIMIFYL